MTMYAKITRAQEWFGEKKDFATPPPSAGDLHPEKPYWVPFVTVTNDTSTGTVPVKRRSEVVVTPTEVTQTLYIEDLTPSEVDSRDTTVVQNTFAVGTQERALAETLFEVTNWVRVLQGNPEFTAQQFKDYLKSKIR